MNQRNEGNTPLHHAARKGNFEAFLLIKEKVDDINPKNEHGNTPLHRAALSEIDGAKKKSLNLYKKTLLKKTLRIYLE